MINFNFSKCALFLLQFFLLTWFFIFVLFQNNFTIYFIFQSLFFTLSFFILIGTLRLIFDYFGINLTFSKFVLNFLVKTDNLYMTFFRFLKTVFISFISKKYLNVTNQILLNLKSFSCDLFSSIKKKNPKVFTSLEKILFFYQLNKKTFWLYIRLYFLISVILYALAFVALSFTIFDNSDSYIFIINFFVQLYRFWTLPFKNYRYLIKFIFIIPYKILSYFWSIIRFFVNLIKEIFRKKPSAECVSKKDEKWKEELKKDIEDSPKINPYIDPTQYELNCLKNKVYKSAEVAKLAKKSFDFLRFVGQSMDQLDNHEDIKNLSKNIKPKGKSLIKSFSDSYQKINSFYPCPGEHEKNLSNKSLEEDRFKKLFSDFKDDNKNKKI